MGTKKDKARQAQAAERLKRAREARYGTAVEAAKALGVNQNTYLLHENGHRAFDADAAAHYAVRLGVAPEYLLYGAEGFAARMQRLKPERRAILEGIVEQLEKEG